MSPLFNAYKMKHKVVYCKGCGRAVLEGCKCPATGCGTHAPAVTARNPVRFKPKKIDHNTSKLLNDCYIVARARNFTSYYEASLHVFNDIYKLSNLLSKHPEQRNRFKHLMRQNRQL